MCPVGVFRHVGELRAGADVRLRAAAGIIGAGLDRDALQHLGKLKELGLEHGFVLELADHVDVVRAVDLLNVVPNALLRAGLKHHGAVGGGAVVEVAFVGGVFVRRDGGTDAHDAVIFPPVRRDLYMADCVVDMAAHVRGALDHHGIDVCIGEVVVRINRGAVRV